MNDKENENQRTCIVTKQTSAREHLIRFVVDPENHVVPDIKEKLPGRGVWIKAHRTLIEKAVTKSMFNAGFKSKVSVDPALAQMVETGLMNSLSGRLAMAKKSGLAISGFSKAEIQARLGKIAVLFHASDSGRDGVKKLENALKACQHEGGYKKGLPLVCELLTSAQLDNAVGGSNTVHIALLRGGMTSNISTDVTKLRIFNTRA